MTEVYRYRLVGRYADGEEWETAPMEGPAARGDATARARFFAEDDAYEGTVAVQVQTVTYGDWCVDRFSSPPFSGLTDGTSPETGEAANGSTERHAHGRGAGHDEHEGMR